MPMVELSGHPTSKEVVEKYPDLSGRIKILWMESYWDGPLSGYVMLDDVEGYFVNCFDMEWNTRPETRDESCDRFCDFADKTRCCLNNSDRLYLVFLLDAQQIAHIKTEHDIFQKFVGTHTDYNNDGYRNIGAIHHPTESWPGFYDRVRPDIHPLNDNQIVGWTTKLFANKW